MWNELVSWLRCVIRNELCSQDVLNRTRVTGDLGISREAKTERSIAPGQGALSAVCSSAAQIDTRSVHHQYTYILGQERQYDCSARLNTALPSCTPRCPQVSHAFTTSAYSEQ